MSYEIDHIFNLTSAGAEEAERLVDFGMVEGSGNVHPGQGTANRRFFFQGAMLEFLWVSDPREAQSADVAKTGLWRRWANRKRSCSPFGICLRPALADCAGPPFAAWDYRPRYLPAGLSIQVAKDAPVAEPMWFFLAFGKRPDALPDDRREPLDHPIGFRELTDVTITAPLDGEPSATARAVIETGAVTLQRGPEHLLKLTFDEGQTDHQADFRPAMRLVVKW